MDIDDVEAFVSGFADGVEAGLQNLKDDEKLAYALSENMISRIPYYIVIDYIKYFINQNNGILSQMKDNYQPSERSARYSEFLAGIMNDSNGTPQNTASSSSSSTSANASSSSSSTSSKNTLTSTNTTPAKSSSTTTDKNNNTNSTLLGKYPFASQRLLTTNELKAYTANELRIMRNEIFARHGYIFIKGGEMDTYFRKQSWYKPKYSNVNNLMSKIEMQNIQTIKQVEATKK